MSDDRTDPVDLGSAARGMLIVLLSALAVGCVGWLLALAMSLATG